MEYIERESLLCGIGSPESGLDDIINTLIFEHNLDFLHDYDEDEIRVFAKDLISNVRNYIQTEPTADVVEVRHSYWQCSNVRMSSRSITCRYCHRTETISNGEEDFEYCPHCGAKMDGKDG